MLGGWQPTSGPGPVRDGPAWREGIIHAFTTTIRSLMTSFETSVSERAVPSILATLVAWLALLPASPFGAIICDAVIHAPAPEWLPFINLCASTTLLALGHVLPPLKPIRGYLRSITLLVLGYVVMLQAESTEAWRARFSEAPSWQFVFAGSILELIPCLFLTLGLVHSGLTRR